MIPLRAALLVTGVQLLAAVRIQGLPSSAPSSTSAPTPAPAVTTVSPTDTPNLASPLVSYGPVSPRPAPSPPLSTRLSAVPRRSRWPAHRTPSTATLTLSRTRLSNRSRRRYRTAELPTMPTTPTTPTRRTTPIRPTTSLTRLRSEDDGRGGRAVWSLPSENAAVGSEQDTSDLYRRYYSGSSYWPSSDSNSSWWSAVQTGLPALGQGLSQGLSQGLGTVSTALRRSGHHHHHKHQHQPYVAAYWEEPDYGDSAAGGSQVVALAHPHQHGGHGGHQPVYYVSDQKKDDSWNDLTSKLIVLAVIKLLIVKALGIGAFKLFVIGLIKIPLVLGAFALKFAAIVKFFKFIKLFLAVLVIPLLVLSIAPLLLPLLIPLGLLLLPLLLLPLLLLFPVPVLTSGAAGGGTVITITPGRRRREEEEEAIAKLESRVADSRRCLQKMACDVGYRSQAVKGYADWVMWMFNFIKPILGETKRSQLKGYISAYKSGLAGRSCYRKYPCYANNLNSVEQRGQEGVESRQDGGADGGTVSTNSTETGNNGNSGNSTLPIEPADSGSASVEERITYDLNSSSSSNSSNTTRS